ncbi:hypothetical protein L484_016528 [Morus notabilis]|uniref:Protein LIKE COV 2 n=1 Tax=Morus notabilis TaxID=981085 RepID=W9R2C0_9ROSA|nr:hypothetical protein L484_016528 [Morus notabilis]
MAEQKDQSTSIPLSQAENGEQDPEDPAKSPPSSPNMSTREVPKFVSPYSHYCYIDVVLFPIVIFLFHYVQACCFVLQSWVSKKFMTGCVVLFPVAVTFFITWWFIEFVDGFFSPLYEQLGFDIFGLGFVTSLLFVFLVGVFVSSWMGAAVFSLGEWFIKRMPFVKHIYSASKQISAAISPDQNTTAFKEVAIIRHPRVGEYAFGFITSTVTLQKDNEDEELCSVFIPTNHLYIGDIVLINSKEIIRPNLSIREGIGMTAGLNVFIKYNGYWDCASRYIGCEMKVILVPTNTTYIGLIDLVRNVLEIRPQGNRFSLRYVVEDGEAPALISLVKVRGFSPRDFGFVGSHYVGSHCVGARCRGFSLLRVRRYSMW